MQDTIGFIGLGNMGGALLGSLLKSENQLFKKYLIFDILENKTQIYKKEPKVEICKEVVKLIESSKYILIAVKPQTMESLLNEIKNHEISEKIFITIAAGLKTEFYKNILGKKIKLTRVMPNTPYLIGQGAAGISFDRDLNEDEKQKIKNIFDLNGKAIICEEKYLDVVTGLSGSGPAYVFIIIEALADGAVEMGLDRESAYLLAAQTLLGSDKMVLDTGKHPAVLKDMVTSPGGTTIEALRVLEEGKIRSTLIEAVIAATKKSQSF